jgi:hypothetical protein
MNEIANKNDRYRLILYESMQKKGQLKFWEEYDFLRLKSVYSDSSLYESVLIDELKSRNYIELVQVGGALSYRNKFNEIEHPSNQVFDLSVRKEGIDALRGGLIKSETLAHKVDNYIKWGSVLMSFAALIISMVACHKT